MLTGRLAGLPTDHAMGRKQCHSAIHEKERRQNVSVWLSPVFYCPLVSVASVMISSLQLGCCGFMEFPVPCLWCDIPSTSGEKRPKLWSRGRSVLERI